MNQSRRERLKSVLVLLDRAETNVDLVRDDERESIDNMPENLQNSDRYMAMEKAVDCLEDAIVNIHEACKNIDEAIGVR